MNTFSMIIFFIYIYIKVIIIYEINIIIDTYIYTLLYINLIKLVTFFYVYICNNIWILGNNNQLECMVGINLHSILAKIFI